jgi:hypothetical protein
MMAVLKKKSVVLSTVMFFVCLLQGGMVYSSVQDAIKVNEVLTVEKYLPHDSSGQLDYPDLYDSDPVGSGRRDLGENLFQGNLRNGVLQQSKNGLRLHLKSPGRLPGIELGVEMHSLEAFQSVIPPENLPQGWDFKQEQPLLPPPSVNSPDYNGGFLRFIW